MTAPKYGMVLKTPASEAPDGGLLDANPEECDPRRDADRRACRHLHEQERCDLAVDILENLHGNLLPAQRRAGDLDELPFNRSPDAREK